MDNNFEDKIKGLMNAPPEIPFDPKGWNQMEQVLKKTNKPPSSWKTWLPFLLLSIMMLLGGTYFFKYAVAAEKILLLQQELQRIHGQENDKKQSHTKHILSIDTIYQKQVVVIYDTTYLLLHQSTQSPNAEYAYNTRQQNISGRNKPGSGTFRLSAFPFFSPGSSTSFSSTDFQPNRSSYHSKDYFYRPTPEPSLTSKYRPFQDPLSILKKETSVNPRTAFASLQSPLFPDDSAMDMSGVPLWTVDHKKSRKGPGYYLSYMEPSRIVIGATLGSSRQTDVDIDATDLVYIKNTNTGLRAEIGYGDRFSALLGLEYFTNNVEAYSGDTQEGQDRLRRDFPVVSQNTDSDILHEATIDFRYLQIPIAFQYRFLPKKKLHPYLGLGIISKRAIRSKVTFEFLGMGEVYEVFIPGLLPTSFQLNTALCYFGLKYDLTRHWQVQLEARSEFDIGKEETYKYEKNRFLKLNTGLQYSF